jgi:hypothetical protein
MVYLKKHKLVIVQVTDDPAAQLVKIQEALTAVTAILVESDEFNYYPEIPDALATLIRFNGELSKLK